jgi:hypothetical protein
MKNPIKNEPLPRRCLPYQQVAPLFERTPEWVREMIRLGRIEAIRVGRSLFVTLDEVERIQREGVVAPTREDA